MSGTAVITGAARGIGRAIAERLVVDGYRLVLVDVSPELAGVAVTLEARGVEVAAVQANVIEDQGIAAVVAAAGGEVDLLVNNAGITRDARVVNMTEGQFSEVIEVNLGGAYRLTRALLDSFEDGAAIVNVASRSYLGNFGQFNYSMSKGGIVGMTRALALELAPRVRCNAIAPGLIGTEMVLTIPDAIRQKMLDGIPLGRMGEPAEVAELVSFLGSDRASYITGQVAVIGGGRSLT